MKKYLRKFLCFVVVAVMCTAGVSAAGNSATEFNRTIIRIPAGNSGDRTGTVLGVLSGHQPTKLKDNEGYLTQYMKIPEEVALDAVKVKLHGATEDPGKTITLRVYRWTGSEADSLKGKPLAESVLKNFADNTTYEIYMEENYNGELLFWAGNSYVPGGIGGIWNSPAQPAFDAVLRLDGQVVADRLLESTIFTRKIEEQVVDEKIRNAYTLHEATEYSVNKLQETERELKSGKKTVLDVNEAGRWVSYNNVDFGSDAPGAMQLKILNRGCDDHTVEIQLVIDDAEKGDIIGSAMTYYKAADPFEEDINIRINREITGVHDVYLLFDYPGISLVSWQFAKEKLPYTSLDKLQAEFKPVAQENIIDDYRDTWVGSDMVGRKLPSSDTVGNVKEEEKYVAVFYWVWHAQDEILRTKDQHLNVQNVLDLYEGDDTDIIYNWDYAGWKSSGLFYWNESIYGYFYGLDEWVRRKEMELLSAADVDLIVLDCPADMYSGGYLQVCDVIHNMRKDGIDAPKLVLRLEWGPSQAGANLLERYYNECVETGLYSDTYFMYQGKPLVMNYIECCDFKTGDPERDALRQEMKEAFTFRSMQPHYYAGPQRDDQWPWLEVYPQNPYGKTETGGVECVGVGIAQNTVLGYSDFTAFSQQGTFGRSFTYKDKFAKLSEGSDYYGYNIQEQWDRAHELDPRFVFVTGWNELSGGRSPVYHVNAVPNSFGDTFCDEYSRDIIPTKGDFKDTYYMQLISNIRKFKGVGPTPVANEPKTVAMGDFASWETVEPEFIGYKGGTQPRDEYSVGARMKYRNYTGRNDIVSSKVTRDAENIYFYVETAENLTPHTDHAWMRLFINTDRTYNTGWEGYDFVINRVSPTENKVFVEKNTGIDNSWKWEKSGEGEYIVKGNKMMLKIPRTALELEGKTLDFEFKWNDNMQQDGYLMDFYVNGDTAPVGRLNYHYIEDASGEKTPENEFVVPYKQLHDLVKYDIAVFIDNPKGFVSGDVELIDATNTDVTPLIINDKTMVPIRFISESLDAQVSWDAETSTATITKMLTRIMITEGENRMRVGKRYVDLQSPAVTINDRLYVPLRDIAEGMGLECHWSDEGLIIIGETAYRTATEFTVNKLLDFYMNIDKKQIN